MLQFIPLDEGRSLRRAHRFFAAPTDDNNGGNGGNGGNGDGGEEERLYQKAEHAAKMAWLEQIKDKLDPGAAAEMQVRLAV